MIGSLRGTLAFAGLDHLLVEVGGVGYLVHVPRPLLGNSGPLGAELLLYTTLVVREDALTLYGFVTIEQRDFFETLLGVTGIGPKVALNLLSAATPDELRFAIAGGDVARLVRVPGLGKKTAERLVLELKGKIDLKGLPVAPGTGVPAVIAVNTELTELLISLGYSATEATAAVASLPADAPTDLEDRLRLALRFFGGV